MKLNRYEYMAEALLAQYAIAGDASLLQHVEKSLRESIYAEARTIGEDAQQTGPRRANLMSFSSVLENCAIQNRFLKTSA